jgi:acetylornithine deacetylase/succinyl-diaminopimelate desuccinylase-like protein
MPDLRRCRSAVRGNAGIPTYGHFGLAGDINDSRIHGRDERVPVKSFFQGDEYLYRLVKALAGGQ